MNRFNIAQRSSRTLLVCTAVLMLLCGASALQLTSHTSNSFAPFTCSLKPCTSSSECVPYTCACQSYQPDGQAYCEDIE